MSIRFRAIGPDALSLQTQESQKDIKIEIELIKEKGCLMLLKTAFWSQN
jgi:hypothetical protein